jgi:acyl-CoA synthetase (AMP-forming)/AMP-acid ligase II
MTEPGEILAVLTDQPGVTDAVVLAREDVVPGETVLVAYVVSTLQAEDLALGEALRRRLPRHLLPAAVVVMPELPLTPAGKLDRAALPVPRLVSRVDTCATPSPW